MSENAVPRRAFLGATAVTALSYSRVMGANERIQLGLIGCGERGRGDLGNFVRTDTVIVTALCDIYETNIEAGKKVANNSSLKTFSDHRKLLEMPGLDAVLIAVPDHWHSRIAIDALNAGKDVYVEKPLTLKIEEGPEVVKAARINNRICQVGMQQRSGKHYLQAKQEYMDTNKLGKITLARTWWHGNTYHLRKAPPSLATQPSNLDWAHFLGPLKWRDWDPQQYFNWRAYLDFGGGQVTDLFTHWIDVVHMFMGQDIPIAASAAGGVYHYKDGRTAPDTINVLLEYPSEFTATFEATLVPGITRRGRRNLRHGGPAVHRPQPLRVHACRPRRAAGRREGVQQSRPRPHQELPGLREVAEAAQWRRADRPPLGAGFAPRQHLVHAEAAHRFRPGPRRDPALLGRCYTGT